MNQEISEHADSMINAVSIKKHALDITSLVLVAVLLQQDVFLTLLLQKHFQLETLNQTF